MQILIPGGAGFIGSHLADALLREGHSVRDLDCMHPQMTQRGHAVRLACSCWARRPACDRGFDAEAERLVMVSGVIDRIYKR